MSIGRQMDKEVVVQIHNEILFSFKTIMVILQKKLNIEGKALIQYINTYIWNLERW